MARRGNNLVSIAFISPHRDSDLLRGITGITSSHQSKQHFQSQSQRLLTETCNFDRWHWALLGLKYDHHGEFTSDWHCYYCHNRVFKPPLWQIHELEHTLSPVSPRMEAGVSNA